ncbi:aldehyde dehydrogenase family protein [Accumulibacter sp.]|jgi:acyl-CoA reductase-like NAD-dependent aldehyde dehydrogenase|uniref:aldehyde dehydrogenase family protein n=1 Tax=Accumulibacter sp. TaxID=2053492 RepID=UPI002B9511BA|nr:aldehyde dehydrogenase family protein [Accumulibacter sp.]HPU79120.1 aldehyde dehydrogenase family protein [Accumulibacter sp.]
MTATDEILAIPLWINGHAYLTMAPAFLDVCDPRNGQVRRRTPLCGDLEARAAVEAARAALAAWSAQTVGQRAALLAALGDALAEYGGHFAALIAEETGRQVEMAAVEVGNAVSLLRATAGGVATSTGSSVVAIVSDQHAPLLGPLQRAVPALLSGATVVLKPSPRAPSAAFALAELTARSGFPGGVFNILHGDQLATEALCASKEVSLLLVAGEPAFGARVAAIATRHGKPFAD